MPLSYNEVRKLILQTLEERPEGTKVQVPNQQNYELALLDYVQQLETSMSTSIVGIADSTTDPIEPPSARVAYLSQVGVNTTVTFKNFIDASLDPIEVTTDADHVAFITLFWNTNYWQAQAVMIPVINGGGEVTGAVRYDEAQGLEDAQKTQARENIGAASQKDVDDINQILFTQYTALSMSRTPASFEKGIETEVTLNWSTKFNNQEIEPDSLEVKKGNEVLTSDKTLKTIKDSVTNTQAYSMTAVIKGITKTASVTVNAYYPMYFGASAKNALESADILAMTKQPIKSSPAGNATVEVGANEYLWLCVPSTMSVNSVKSGGFDVPMAAPVTVAVDGKGDYKCYRSASPFAEGTFNGVIA